MQSAVDGLIMQDCKGKLRRPAMGVLRPVVDDDSDEARLEERV